MKRYRAWDIDKPLKLRKYFKTQEEACKYAHRLIEKGARTVRIEYLPDWSPCMTCGEYR